MEAKPEDGKPDISSLAAKIIDFIIRERIVKAERVVQIRDNCDVEKDGGPMLVEGIVISYDPFGVDRLENFIAECTRADVEKWVKAMKDERNKCSILESKVAKWKAVADSFQNELHRQEA